MNPVEETKELVGGNFNYFDFFEFANPMFTPIVPENGSVQNGARLVVHVGSTTIERELLANVRVYTDDDAFRRDERGRPPSSVELKALHDELSQLAINLKLATVLTVVDWRRPRPFREACRVATSRPTWWPANEGVRNRRNLLALPLAPTSEATLGSDWRAIRLLAEQGKNATLWHDDPALGFAPAVGVGFGRAASVGHEGFVHYFVDGAKEREWAQALERAGLRVSGVGESAYRQYFKVPGRLGGR